MYKEVPIATILNTCQKTKLDYQTYPKQICQNNIFPNYKYNYIVPEMNQVDHQIIPIDHQKYLDHYFGQGRGSLLFVKKGKEQGKFQLRNSQTIFKYKLISDNEIIILSFEYPLYSDIIHIYYWNFVDKIKLSFKHTIQQKNRYNSSYTFPQSKLICVVQEFQNKINIQYKSTYYDALSGKKLQELPTYALKQKLLLKQQFFQLDGKSRIAVVRGCVKKQLCQIFMIFECIIIDKNGKQQTHQIKFPFLCDNNCNIYVGCTIFGFYEITSDQISTNKQYLVMIKHEQQKQSEQIKNTKIILSIVKLNFEKNTVQYCFRSQLNEIGIQVVLANKNTAYGLYKFIQGAFIYDLDKNQVIGNLRKINKQDNKYKTKRFCNNRWQLKGCKDHTKFYNQRIVVHKDHKIQIQTTIVQLSELSSAILTIHLIDGSINQIDGDLAREMFELLIGIDRN